MPYVRPVQRVLVVEDDPVIADALRRRLEAEGFAVEVCHDGRVAVERFDDSVDLLVLDVMLPGLDGLEVCRRSAQRPVPCSCSPPAPTRPTG